MSDSVQQALNSKMDEEDQKVLKEVGTFLFTANSGRRRGLTVEQLLEMPNRTEHDLNIDFNPSTVIPGPSQGLSEEEVCKVIVEERTRSRRGEAAMYWEEIQDEIAKNDPELAKDVRGINFVLPRVMSGQGISDFRTNVVLLSNAEDCARIAKNHVKKQPNFTGIFAQSVIATTDNDHWKKQRSHLNEVFLPKMSLAKIFPRSLSRAEKCADVMKELSNNAGEYGVNCHDFFLHEAQAQLQLALFGMDEEFMESTNKPIRDGFAGRAPFSVVLQNTVQMMRAVSKNEDFAAASDAEVISGEKPIFGPLSKSVDNAAKDLGLNVADQFGNMLLILFAGHDTTAHTMTWLTYELAHHPEYQKRVHEEVDAFFERLDKLGRPMVYEDCDHLPFLTRCVMETLRLWTAVPNGTFRELQYDDYVKGPGGKPTLLKKGTYVQVVNMMRQRNPTLWGADAMEFNPDREFREDEIWGGDSFKGYNPSSERFSPFTFQPRDCLGKNFAQMEMRTILANLFRRFSFELSEPYKNYDRERDGPLENPAGTMGPKDLTPAGRKRTEENLNGIAGEQKAIAATAGIGGSGVIMGMWLNVHERSTPSKL